MNFDGITFDISFISLNMINPENQAILMNKRTLWQTILPNKWPFCWIIGELIDLYNFASVTKLNCKCYTFSL